MHLIFPTVKFIRSQGKLTKCENSEFPCATINSGVYRENLLEQDLWQEEVHPARLITITFYLFHFSFVATWFWFFFSRGFSVMELVRTFVPKINEIEKLILTN